MAAPSILSGRFDRLPVDFDLSTGLRRFREELVTDLGIRVPELHEWAAVKYGTVWPADWTISESATGSTIVRIEAGFEYDGASIPGLAQSLVMGPKERYELAGAIHDKLYQLQVGRAAADLVFWHVATNGIRHVGPVRGYLGWTALRAFGWWAYSQKG